MTVSVTSGLTPPARGYLIRTGAHLPVMLGMRYSDTKLSLKLANAKKDSPGESQIALSVYKTSSENVKMHIIGI
jgi:hypothetical protein